MRGPFQFHFVAAEVTRLTYSGVSLLRILRATLIPLLLTFPVAAFSQEKITYQDHVLPLIENNCAKCHNPDKKKGDLDLTSYNGALKGGGSGQVVIAGNPDSSKLLK